MWDCFTLTYFSADGGRDGLRKDTVFVSFGVGLITVVVEKVAFLADGRLQCMSGYKHACFNDTIASCTLLWFEDGEVISVYIG